MADERFAWSRASKETCAFELKQRNVLRELTKDSPLVCLACGKKPMRKEVCYYPAAALSNNNKIIGHKDCIDRICAQIVAQGASTAASAKQPRVARALRVAGGASAELRAQPAPSITPSIVNPPAVVMPVPDPQPLAFPSNLASGVAASGLPSRDWLHGWHDGILFALERKRPMLAEAPEEWLRGWHEGVIYGTEILSRQD